MLNDLVKDRWLISLIILLIAQATDSPVSKACHKSPAEISSTECVCRSFSRQERIGEILGVRSEGRSALNLLRCPNICSTNPWDAR
ncbi:hypothetical protein B0H13DRAFT_2007573 [Mycena leptocephala]|nr:hypothetical protein B0H13DRAFT_2007573 [Mycena leptocephala]